jgi:hypothetical protein
MTHLRKPRLIRKPIIITGLFGGMLLAVGIGAGAAALHSSHTTIPSKPAVSQVVVKPSKSVAATPVTTTKPAPQPSQPASAPVVHHTAPATAPAAAATVAAAAPAPASTVTSLQPAPTTSQPASSTTSSSTTTAPTSTASPSPAVRYSSTNWSGYAAINGTFTSVGGSWTVPTPTSGSTTDNSLDAAWVGIGGVNSKDLIQVGTDDVVATDGTITVSAFYELLPANAHYIASLTVNPGDAIHASVSQTAPGTWAIMISNVTTGKDFSTSVSYTSSLSSAEWIEEDPSYTDRSLAALDRFGTIHFSECTANAQTGDAFTPASITLVDNANTAHATPSALYNGAFSVTRS